MAALSAGGWGGEIVTEAPARQLVVFTLAQRRYALELHRVARVVRAVEISPLPKAPAVVQGVIDVQGNILPVVDPRRRFGLPAKPLEPEDHFILARTRERTVAMVVDTLVGVIAVAETEIAKGDTVLPGLEYLSGVAKLADGLVFIHDLSSFLSLEEEKLLAGALVGQGAGK